MSFSTCAERSCRNTVLKHHPAVVLASAGARWHVECFSPQSLELVLQAPPLPSPARPAPPPPPSTPVPLVRVPREQPQPPEALWCRSCQTTRSTRRSGDSLLCSACFRLLMALPPQPPVS